LSAECITKPANGGLRSRRKLWMISMERWSGWGVRWGNECKVHIVEGAYSKLTDDRDDAWT